MSLKLVHKAFLLIAIPLGLVLIFLWALTTHLEQAEKDTAVEMRAGAALMYVNLVLYDALNGAAGMMLYRATGDQKFMKAVAGNALKLESDREELNNIAKNNPNDSSNLQQFVALCDQFESLTTEAHGLYDNNSFLSSTTAAAKLRNHITRVNVAAETIIEDQVKSRQQLLEQRNANSKHLQNLMKVFTAAIVLLAMALAFYLSLTFQRRLNVLLKNTRSIAINQSLEKPLSGGDELAQLDATIHDLSHQLNQAREQERALIDNTAEIICSFDSQLRVTQVNPAVMKILGVSDIDFLGTTIQAWVHEEDRSSTLHALDACQSGARDTRLDVRMKTADGRYLDTVWNARWSDEKKSFFCVISDITDRKNAERLKQEVLTLVSHDLRSPLSSLKLTLELLSDGVFGQLNEQGTAVVKKSERSVTSLVAMINDLLEMEKLNFGTFDLNLKKTSIDEVARQAIDMIASQAEKKEIRILRDCDNHSAQMDPDQMRRVIVNLLTNAIKFSPASSAIEIKAQLCPDEKSGAPLVEVRINDQGPGIPAEKLEQIFEKFGQAGVNEESEKAGTGLGLAIAKQIVEAHGGTIGVESSQGKGSSFWFRLPAELKV
jgi:PAS domain S-box-containing protein